MAHERNAHEAAREVAVQALKNELNLAIELLRKVKEARETMALEAQAIDSARTAFRHAVDALDRMPQLRSEEMQFVQRLIDEFRTVLAQLNA